MGHGQAILLGIIVMFLMSVVVVNTITLSNLGTSTIKVYKDSFSDDPDLVLVSKKLRKVANAEAGPAVGDSAPGVESSSALPRVNNILKQNKYAYEFEVKEATVNSFQAGENFKIEVYMNDGTTNSLVATLYMKQDTVDDTSVEGVTVMADTASNNIVGDLFSIVVTRQ